MLPLVFTALLKGNARFKLEKVTAMRPIMQTTAPHVTPISPALGVGTWMHYSSFPKWLRESSFVRQHPQCKDDSAWQSKASKDCKWFSKHQNLCASSVEATGNRFWGLHSIKSHSEDVESRSAAQACPVSCGVCGKFLAAEGKTAPWYLPQLDAINAVRGFQYYVKHSDLTLKVSSRCSIVGVPANNPGYSCLGKYKLYSKFYAPQFGKHPLYRRQQMDSTGNDMWMYFSVRLKQWIVSNSTDDVNVEGAGVCMRLRSPEQSQGIWDVHRSGKLPGRQSEQKYYQANANIHIKCSKDQSFLVSKVRWEGYAKAKTLLHGASLVTGKTPSPTHAPTRSPTLSPSLRPTLWPTQQPTLRATMSVHYLAIPTNAPSLLVAEVPWENGSAKTDHPTPAPYKSWERGPKIIPTPQTHSLTPTPCPTSQPTHSAGNVNVFSW